MATSTGIPFVGCGWVVLGANVCIGLTAYDNFRLEFAPVPARGLGLEVTKSNGVVSTWA